ncbi:MAG: excinuclease ABC subunit UvrA [Bacteroidales bacterium]|nr:excinuclease ABC subunit UvrA [Bacteroidales bacterium]
MKQNTDSISVYGARVHNLKNIDVQIPRYSLTVITGLSGSGKSSLAFDTIYAEGQRRYIETFSAYARNFLGNLERPDVDEISGLSPVISIEQKTTNKNPRSTVGTQTEVYDYIRLLFARAGEAYSYLTGKKMVKYTEEQILELILDEYRGEGVYILAPAVRGRKGHYQELFESMRKKGYLNVRVDGQLREIEPGMRLDRYKTHDVEIVIDKLIVGDKESQRLRKSIQTAMRAGEGLIMLMKRESGEIRHYSRQLMCADTGLSYPDPAPHHFSFNSPQGACPRCKGLGQIRQVDLSKIIPDQQLSIYEGAIAPLGKYRNSLFFWQVEALLKRHGFGLKTPVRQLTEESLDEILNGTDEPLNIKNPTLGLDNYSVHFEGVLKYVEMMQEGEASASAQKWANQYVSVKSCPECQGQRLKKESLHFRINGKNIAELAAMDIRELHEWFGELPAHLDDRQHRIADEILKEIQTRLSFLLDVGLDYLSLNRASAGLSGGESQRIRLATQIGSQLINVLYILDEPSIGLHYRDNLRLIKSLQSLRDKGNTVIVVEHDRDMMLSADYVVDLGPRAGRLGGNLVFAGTPDQLLKADTLTARYLRGEEEIPLPTALREGNGHVLTLKGCRGNNLKNIDVSFPLGKLIVVTGVSGSGKSSLVNGTLQAALTRHFYRSLQEPLPFDGIEGIRHIDKIVSVDQSPIGRSPRSNPATYCGVFSDIRNLFVSLPESRIRAYKPGRFSFNVAGGRCEKCKGNGYQTIEMNFLPDVTVPCDECRGKRYNRETLEVRFKGKSIADVLDMTINIAVEFFENQPQIIQKIKTIQDVGLGYLKLGQPSSQLYGGEAQRIKLAAELAKKDTGRTLYVLDEPTTGLHFDDIRVLMDVISRLVDKGNTVVIIEHNVDVIKLADHIIDMGPDGGRKGGRVVCCGTPRQVAQCPDSFTARCLQEVFPDCRPAKPLDD